MGGAWRQSDAGLGWLVLVLALAAIGLLATGAAAGTDAPERGPAAGIVDAASAPGGASPGERVGSVLDAVAEAEGLPAAAPIDCPGLGTALSWHAQRLGEPVAPLPELPRELDAALGCLLGAVHRANLAMDATFADVPTSRLLPYVTGEQTMPPPSLLAGRSHEANLQASQQMARAVDRALTHLEALQSREVPLPAIDLEPVLRFDPGTATTYTDNYALVVDLGGDDLYDNHAGGIFAAAGNGIYEVEEGSPWHEIEVLGRPASVGGNTQDATAVLTSSLVLDLDGDDTYGVEKPAMLDDAENGCAQEPVVPMVGTIGAGIVGSGHLYDLAGDDTFTGRTQTTGAGHILGVGVLYAGPGNDTFEAVRSAQGQGLLGGVGVLVTEPGASTYRMDMPEGGVFNADLRFCDEEIRYAQGSSFDRRNGPLLPSVGVLADRGGDDVYRSGSLSQGFGQGPGAGVLVDRDGDDDYAALDQAQAFAQGRSRAFNPNAPWGSGQAVLADQRGDDRYELEARGQGQALAEDPTEGPMPDPTNAVSWALDRDEALATFLDAEGTDAYLGPDGRTNDAVHVTGVLGVFWDGG